LQYKDNAPVQRSKISELISKLCPQVWQFLNYKP